MFYACWEVDRLGASARPKRSTAFRTRSDAVAWMGGHRRRKRYALVVLLLQTSVYPDGRTEVVPEFPIKALGDAGASGDGA